jgi:hypothetical protein
MAKKQPAPQIFEHKPQPTIAKAIDAAKRHVTAANRASKRK